MVFCPRLEMVEGEMLKQEVIEVKQAKAKDANLLDWLLAIDVCLI
jgi:hypothetical protein